MREPTLEDLHALVRWPYSTIGEQNEIEVIKTLLSLCRKFGFGRVPQLAKQIEDIWRNPEKLKSYEKEKEEHLAWMEEARKQEVKRTLAELKG